MFCLFVFCFFCFFQICTWVLKKTKRIETWDRNWRVGEKCGLWWSFFFNGMHLNFLYFSFPLPTHHPLLSSSFDSNLFLLLLPLLPLHNTINTHFCFLFSLCFPHYYCCHKWVKKCSPITWRLERIEWEETQRMLTYHKRREREKLNWLGRQRECSGPPEEQRELTGETHRIWLTQHKSRENGLRREITQICPQEERELPDWV